MTVATPLRQQGRVADALQHIAAALLGQDQYAFAGDLAGIEDDRAVRPPVVAGNVEPMFVGSPAFLELA